MKILIIEDESLVARNLEQVLSQIEPGVEIVEVITSVEQAKNWFSTHTQPDLILADIQLSDGMSFEIFENMHHTCPIIFTTAYNEFAIRAFKLNSIDYLLKPVDTKELKSALDKYKALSPDTVWGEQLKMMIDRWGKNAMPQYKERFLSLHRNTLVPVNQHEIAFFHKEELIYLHTLSNERYISEYQTLDEIEALLDPKYFFRVNRQYILHIQSVGRIRTTHKGLTIQLKSPFHSEMDVSREKAAAFKQWVG